jgi:hypothetical protein
VLGRCDHPCVVKLLAACLLPSRCAELRSLRSSLRACLSCLSVRRLKGAACNVCAAVASKAVRQETTLSKCHLHGCRLCLVLELCETNLEALVRRGSGTLLPLPKVRRGPVAKPGFRSHCTICPCGAQS